MFARRFHRRRSSPGAADCPRRPNPAFTLVEALVATSLTVLAGAAILLALQSSLQTAETGLEQSVAQGIADQLLDEAASTKYPLAGALPSAAPIGTNGAVSRLSFDDLDDYKAYSSLPADRWGRLLGVGGAGGMLRHPATALRSDYFTSWRTTVDVFFVNDANLSQRLATGQTSNHRAVKVRVLFVNADGTTRQLAEVQRIFAHVPPPS